LFQRDRDVIDSRLKGSIRLIDAAIGATKPNTLFLSVCDAFNIEEAKSIFQWFKHFIIVDGIITEDEVMGTVKLFEDSTYREKIKDYLTTLNLGIIDLEVESKDFEESELGHEIPEESRRALINFLTGKKGYSINTL
ncbi:MAG: ATP-binding protein, partial [bacterium]